MLREVEGFIISETPYGETSKIINVFTKDCGVIGIMCKGAKSLKSKNRVSTMRLTFAKFNIYLKQGKLSTLVSADIINPLKRIKEDIILISYLSYLTELTHQVIKQSNSPKIYDDFINAVLKSMEVISPSELVETINRLSTSTFSVIYLSIASLTIILENFFASRAPYLKIDGIILSFI